jgi:hypothetical protein
MVHGTQKIENWTLWIGDLIVTPLYAYRGLILSSQYLILQIYQLI